MHSDAHLSAVDGDRQYYSCSPRTAALCCGHDGLGFGVGRCQEFCFLAFLTGVRCPYVFLYLCVAVVGGSCTPSAL